MDRFGQRDHGRHLASWRWCCCLDDVGLLDRVVIDVDHTRSLLPLPLLQLLLLMLLIESALLAQLCTAQARVAREERIKVMQRDRAAASTAHEQRTHGIELT